MNSKKAKKVRKAVADLIGSKETTVSAVPHVKEEEVVPKEGKPYKIRKTAFTRKNSGFKASVQEAKREMQ